MIVLLSFRMYLAKQLAYKGLPCLFVVFVVVYFSYGLWCYQAGDRFREFRHRK